jgi:hypothetical protein
MTIVTTNATPSNKRSLGWDGMGMTASGLCIAHCILTPVLLFAVPLAGLAVLENELIHKALVAIVIVVGVIAFVPGLRLHGKYHMLPFALLGVGSLLFAALAAEALWGEAGETVFTTIGGSLMVYSHCRNRTFCKACRVCEDDSGCVDGKL